MSTKISPLALGEALALCYEHQYLCGAPMNDQYSIDLVIVAPHGAQEQALYVQRLLNDEADVVGEAPPQATREYDVVLIAFTTSEEPQIIMTPLRSYQQERAPLYGATEYGASLPDLLLVDEHNLYLN